MATTEGKRVDLATGLISGGVAGLFLAFVELIVGQGAGLEAVGTALLGADADPGQRAGIGFLVSLVPAIVWGGLYAWALKRASPSSRGSVPAGVTRGFLWGSLAWFVDVLVIARLILRADLGPPTVAQWLLHACVYGVSLGWIFAVQQIPIGIGTPTGRPPTAG